MRPHSSNSIEIVNPVVEIRPSGTSPLASYKEVPPWDQQYQESLQV